MSQSNHPEIGQSDRAGQPVLDPTIVRKVARLARLAPDEAEFERLGHELGQILDHFQSLEALDTAAVEPAYHPHDLQNCLRQDEVLPSYDASIFMELAPRHKDGCLMVPRTFE
jgi:aspartyl-tRNA(Asn)/glutamyl-tRNA(Gln) amidotransferase subunit C